MKYLGHYRSSKAELNEEERILIEKKKEKRRVTLEAAILTSIGVPLIAGGAYLFVKSVENPKSLGNMLGAFWGLGFGLGLFAPLAVAGWMYKNKYLKD